MSNRRKIRETVLQACYAAQIGDHPPEQVIQTIINPEISDDPVGLAFAERLFLRTLDHRDQADEIIKKHIANWEIDRLALLDRMILQQAITELIAFDDIPTKVTINEAIEIAKKFSTEKSGKFINGILDAAALTLGDENRLHKQGRGLKNQPARKMKPRKPKPDEWPDDDSYATSPSSPYDYSDAEKDEHTDSNPDTPAPSDTKPPRNSAKASSNDEPRNKTSRPKKKRIKRR